MEVSRVVFGGEKRKESERLTLSAVSELRDGGIADGDIEGHRLSLVGLNGSAAREREGENKVIRQAVDAKRG